MAVSQIGVFLRFTTVFFLTQQGNPSDAGLVGNGRLSKFIYALFILHVDENHVPNG